MSIGYVDKVGIDVGQKYQRVTPRLNLDIQALDWFKIGVSSSFASVLLDPGHGMHGRVAGQVPISVPYDSAGNFIRAPTGNDRIQNPLLDDRYLTTEERIGRFLGGYYAELNFGEIFAPLTGLRYRINVGQDFKQWRKGEFLGEESTDRWPGVNQARYQQRQDYGWTVENLLFYDKRFGEHNIGLTLLQSAEAARWEKTKVRLSKMRRRDARRAANFPASLRQIK